jgi:ATP-dependent helicase/nuclease subunit A
VVADERSEGWLAALNPAIYPSGNAARRPEANQAPGTPMFGDDTVVKRPEKAKVTGKTVKPGVHIPEAGVHRVIWWDPRPLKLGLKPTIGLAQEKILTEDTEGRAAAARAHFESWRAGREQNIERGSKPTRTIETATERARSAAPIEGPDDITIVDARWQGARPGGARFGTLVHAVLATVDLAGDRKAVAAHAEIHARLLGAVDAERDAAVDVVTAALMQPLLRRAAAANAQRKCRRETAIVTRLEDGTLIESVADLAFSEADEWIVVDFKTDGELGAHEPRYRRQVALYVRGVSEATSSTARGHLLLL